MSMQGWIKLLGAACILWGAAGCGIWFAGHYRKRIAELEQLKQMVFLLKDRYYMPVHRFRRRWKRWENALVGHWEACFWRQLPAWQKNQENHLTVSGRRRSFA